MQAVRGSEAEGVVAGVAGGVAGAEGGEFSAVAPAVVQRVADAMRALVRAVPGDVKTAAELERGLGVSKKLAWQVFKVAEAAEPAVAAGFVPGADPVRKLLVAAERSGLAAAVCAEVGEAFKAFEAFVDDQAGDRTNFLSMLGMSGSDDTDHVERLHRRACFRSYSHFMGAQLGTRYGVMMVKKEASEGHDAFVSLRAKLGLRRLRQDATVIVDRYFVTSGDTSDVKLPRPIDAVANEKIGAPILPGFSTKPLPRVTSVMEEKGIARVELLERAVGLSNAVDFVLGTVTRNVATGPLVPGRPHGFHTLAKVDIPMALFVTDVLVHAGDYGPQKPELHIYADPGADESRERRERSPLIKTRDRIEYLGRGLPKTSGDVPRSTEMIAHSCGVMGWDTDEFDVYRLRIEYPLMHTVVRMAFPVAE